MPQDSKDTVLLLAFGQSNADVHIAGPRFPSDLWDDPNILTPDDGAGIRGIMGRGEQPDFTNFVPACQFEPNNQSLLLAAAARLRYERSGTSVIIRSVAKGGRRFHAIKQGDREVEGLISNVDGSPSLHFQNLVATIRMAHKAAKNEGQEISRTCILWLHGESDRAMKTEEYLSSFVDLIDRVNVATGIPDIMWRTVQPGGTGPGGTGNDWPNRLALTQETLQEIAPMIGVGHVCEFVDQSHYSAKGKLLLGEWLGHAIARHLKNEHFKLTAAPSARLTKPNTVTLIFSTAIATISQSDVIEGFTLRVKGRNVSVVSVKQTAPYQVDIVSDTDLTDLPVSIDYAYRRNPSKDPDQKIGRAYGFGNLRTPYEIQSVLAPGRRLFEPVPAFSIPLSP